MAITIWRLAFGLVVLASLGPWGSVSAVRTDVVDENYLVGQLRWMDGKGRILWGAAAPEVTVDPGQHAAGVFDEFMSDPVPRTLYLNVSRVIQSDLFFRTSSSVSIDVILHADQKFLTGGTPGNAAITYCQSEAELGCTSPDQRPGSDGYFVATHRMHAELDEIPKGTKITLRVVHNDENNLEYGFGGSHASVVRLPVFSPEEVLFRIPKYQNRQPVHPEEDARPPAAVRDLIGGLPVVGLLAVGFVGGTPRGRRPVFVAALLMVLGAFGGCFGSSGRAPGEGPQATSGLGGSGKSYIVADEENETGLAGSARGSIFGVIADPDSLPVNGAYVLLLGTPHSARTDPKGRFHFMDLDPGTYWLRVDRDGFLAFETKVGVEAAAVTKVEITLQWVTVKDIDFRPHRHDYWDKKDSILLRDVPGISARLPAPLTILPGTTDIELNFTWVGGNTAFAYTVRPDDPYNATLLYPRASGVPYHIRTTWEMTDPGHSLYSYWGGFAMYTYPVPLCDRNLYVTTIQTPMCEDPQYRVRLTIHKGVVPLEPAHPDHWGESMTFPVIQKEKTSLMNYCGLELVLYRTFEIHSPVSGCPLDWVYGEGVTTKAYNASWAAKDFVPFETQWLEVRLHASRPVTGSISSTPWTLFYRDAHWPPEIAASQRAPLPTPDLPNLNWTWKVPLDPGQADPPYAPYSMWLFFVAPTDQDAQVIDDYANLGKLPDLTLTVIAHRDPL